MPIPMLNDCHQFLLTQFLLTQFRIKVAFVKHMLYLLDISKSVVDDNVSLHVLKSAAFALDH